jgi:hypothetical protein
MRRIEVFLDAVPFELDAVKPEPITLNFGVFNDKGHACAVDRWTQTEVDRVIEALNFVKEGCVERFMHGKASLWAVSARLWDTEMPYEKYSRTMSGRQERTR